ncbi:MAG: ergothioneine biosynthesis protein EgtC [Nocardioidaceae bacterium]
MCRHLAYLGSPRTLEDLVVAPPHSLYEQSWAPRRQRHGTINVDGFGVGWYVDSRRTPVRYRRAQPIWTDASFESLAPTISSACLVAAVRSATPGTAADESAAAPFTHDRWLFSHNGRLYDWPTARKALLAGAADVPDTRVGVDSALLFGLALAAWQAGASLVDGLLDAARAVGDHGGGRLTMLAADGTSIAGLVLGEPLHVLASGAGVVIASEPDVDGPWREIADGTAVQVDASGLTETRL